MANNPGDTHGRFSNALLRNYDTLQQSSIVLNGQYRSWNVEWYLQDNWRVTPKLTWSTVCVFLLDPAAVRRGASDLLVERGALRPAAAGILQTAALVNGTRVAVNPLTGAQGPAALIGPRQQWQGLCERSYANGMVFPAAAVIRKA